MTANSTSEVNFIILKNIAKIINFVIYLLLCLNYTLKYDVTGTKLPPPPPYVRSDAQMWGVGDGLEV